MSLFLSFTTEKKLLFFFTFILSNFFYKFCFKSIERYVITFFCPKNCLIFENFGFQNLIDSGVDMPSWSLDLLGASITLISMFGWLYFYKQLTDFFMKYTLDMPFYNPMPIPSVDDLLPVEDLEGSNLDDILSTEPLGWFSGLEETSDTDDSIIESVGSDFGLVLETYSILDYILPHSIDDLMFKSVILYAFVEGFVLYTKLSVSYHYC